MKFNGSRLHVDYKGKTYSSVVLDETFKEVFEMVYPDLEKINKFKFISQSGQMVIFPKAIVENAVIRIEKIGGVDDE